MSEKERQKKDHHRKDKERKAMREHSSPRQEQASIGYGAQKRAAHPEHRRGERLVNVDPRTE